MLLTLDLIAPVISLLNTMVKDSLPLLVIIAVRLACLKWLAQGIMAIWQRQQNAAKLAASVMDREISVHTDQTNNND